MRFSVMTLFPDLIDTIVKTSITGRALSSGYFDLDLYDIRNYAINSYGKIDDTIFGGGTGMLMMCQPIQDCYDAILKKHPKKHKNIYLSPRGKILTQDMVKSLAQEEHLVLLCGHYEGVDQRVLDAGDWEEISIGDYVLTGGELPATILIDSVARMLSGVLPQDAFESDSHYSGILEGPHYTSPRVWEDRSIPDVLLSGHHEKIQNFRYLSALKETLTKRPDLFDKLELDEKTWILFKEFLKED